MPGSHLKFVRTLDFDVLDGLATRAAAEIREPEDALIAFTEAQQKRDALHLKTKARDRGEVQAARPPGRCGVPDQPMDIRDHLIRQHEQERMAQRLNALFTKDEVTLPLRAGHRESAYHTAQEAAAAYDHVQESLTDVITQARDLRTRIQNGTVPEDARKLLADLRKQRAELVAKIAPTKSRHDSARIVLN